MKKDLPRKQKGAAALEFAMVFMIFFCRVLWFGQLQPAVTADAVLYPGRRRGRTAQRRTGPRHGQLPNGTAPAGHRCRPGATDVDPSPVQIPSHVRHGNLHPGGPVNGVHQLPDVQPPECVAVPGTARLWNRPRPATHTVHPVEHAVLTSGDKLFGRLLGRGNPLAADAPTATPTTAALLFYLDTLGQVVDIQGPLRHRLEPPGTHSQQPASLLEYLTPQSSLVIEGTPGDWQGQSLDLAFKGLAGQTLHTRGWVQPEGKGWLLQLLDIGDLVAHRQLTQVREHNQRVSDQISEHLRVCSLARLPEVLQDTLQTVSQHWHIPSVALAVLDEAGQEWRIQGHYTSHDAPALWSNGQALGTSLDSLGATAPVSLEVHRGHSDHPRLQGLFGNTDGFLVPYRDAHGVAAWLLCGFYRAQAHTNDRDWLQLAAALAAPLLSRLREQRHQQQLDRLEALQGLLGTGWWDRRF